MSLSFASVFLCIALSALPLEGKTRRGDDKDWPEFIQKYAVSQHPDEVELWRCILLDPAVPSLSVLLQHGDEAIVARIKGGSSLLKDYPDSFKSCAFIGNLNEVANVEMQKRTVKRQVNNTLSWHKSYHTYNEIRNWSESIAARHPARVRFVPSIGHSHRGLPLFALHVTKDAQNATNVKPKIYIQCLLHAREWISGAVCQCLVEFLVKQYSEGNVLVNRLLRKLEYVFVPVANPDGYELTWFNYPVYRFWRKNTAFISSTTCGGVDLNRNFDVSWSGEGHPCTHFYPGVAPNSEPEVSSIMDYFTSLKPVIGAFDFHSYQQLVLYPYAFSDSEPPHARKISKFAFKTAKAMSKVNSLNFTSIQAGHWLLYNTNGTFIDWAFSDNVSSNNTDSLGRSYRVIPLGVELRPRLPPHKISLTGFLVPPHEILPTCQETFAGLKKFSQIVSAKPIKFRNSL